ncbi:MAG: DNA mismatch repair endonuclease MutL, partial [Clostridium sp.]
ISSLGFRGEALPSIASVGIVNLKSKPDNEDFGGEITIKGGEVLDTKEVGMNKGTIMEVKDLFFNIPARKKFLKTSSREGSLINDIVTRIAISNPNISFKYYNSGKKILHTYGNGILKDVIRTIYGKTISDNLIDFESDGDVISIKGYIGKEEVARGSRNNQSIFVNGRYVKNRTLVVAVENAFKSFATVNKFPFFVLFVDVYPEFVDVNIHPTKEEIKFKEDRAVFKKVFDSVHSAFKEEVFNSFQVPEEKYKEDGLNAEVVENISFEINYKEPLYNFEKEEVDLRTKIKSDEEEKVIIKKSQDINLSDIEKEEALYNKLKNLGGDGKLKSPSTSSQIVTTNYNKENIVDQYTNSNSYLKESNNTQNNLYNTITEISPVNKEEQSLDLPNENLNSDIKNEKAELKNKAPKFPKLRIIGQFNKTYILAEYEEVLYLVDQHAAHEKILFEKYLKEIEEGSIIIQPLLLPSLIDLTIDDYCSYEENIEIFKSSGFNIECFGGNTVAIKEVPYFLGRLNPKSLFMSILDNLKNLGSGKTTEVKY